MNKKYKIIIFQIVLSVAFILIFQTKIAMAAATISLSPTVFSASATQGTNSPNQALTVTNSATDGSVLNWTASDDATWLDLFPLSGSLPSSSSESITLAYSTTTLAPGSYTATITISDPAATNNPQIVTVDLIIVANANVTGYGWIGADNCDGILSCASQTNPLGWISFNCSNTGNCGVVNYGVNVDYAAAANNTITGKAWIGDDTLGFAWLDFDSILTPGMAADNFPAKYDSASGNIVGWAPIVADTSVISWVHFNSNCANYCVHINSDGTIGAAGSSNHYAWAGSSSDTDFTGLGWIDLNTSTASGEVVLPPTNQNQPPNPPGSGGETGVTTPSVGPTADDNPGDVCLNMIRPTFSWTYSDSDGDAMSSYQIQLNTVNNFTTPAIDTGQTTLTAASNEIVLVNLTSSLQYNSTYYWQVRVWDSNNNISGWAAGETFTTPKHATDFTFTPGSPSSNETVTFQDATTFPNGGATAITAWTWIIPDFAFDAGFNANSQNPRGKFISKGSKIVSLNAVDNGTPTTSCSRVQTINIKSPLPIIKEVAP
ncbi:MAG: hypothetical protein HYV52_01185 [Parcubacteria group bacterium]|nr:hypothetical protein [Parcubacteria group bacterium]